MIFGSCVFDFAVVVPFFWALRSDRWRLPVLFAENFIFETKNHLHILL
jgi:hypothetical protein